MGIYKQKEKYFIRYPGTGDIEVSEEIYRAWTYYTNKEVQFTKQYYNRNLTVQGSMKHFPSRLVPIEELTSEPIDNKYLPTAYQAKQEILDILKMSISEVSPDLWIIIEMRYFKGLTECKIAQILGVCQATVSNRLHRALNTIHNVFILRGYSYQDILKAFPNL